MLTRKAADKVGRVVIDGVLDADHYVGPTWYDSLIDADKIWNKFFYYCHKAKSACRFFHPSNTIDDLKSRFQAIEDKAKAEPLIVISPEKVPFLLTHDDLKNFIFISLYSPIELFPVVAETLSLLEQGELRGGAPGVGSGGLCIHPPQRFPDDSTRGVMCSDKRYPLNGTVSVLEEEYKRIASYSEFADVWMTLMLMCSHYNVPVSDPPMRWGETRKVKGTLEIQEEKSILSLFSQNRKIHTATPLLLMTNTYDPVTPKAAGLKMVQKFHKAGFLEQLAEGHCTISAVSKCTLSVVSTYFREGVVPEEADVSTGRWTVCEADNYPWDQRSRKDHFSVPKYNENSQGQMLQMWEMQQHWEKMQAKMAWQQDRVYGKSEGISELLALLGVGVYEV